MSRGGTLIAGGVAGKNLAANENVHVLDWAGLAGRCPGDCFEADGFHLTPEGRDYYTMRVAEVFEAVGG